MAANGKRMVFLILSFFATSTSPGANALTVRWGHQLVTPTNDTVFGGFEVDSNDSIYIVVSRRPKDAPKSHPQDRYLLKFNQVGKQLWSKQLGKNRDENPLHLSVDGLAADDQENIYIFGYTSSSLCGENKGGYDAFVVKYDQAGDQQQVWQFGTVEHDVCAGLDIDASGNLYAAGYTYGSFAKPHKGGADMFIAAYDKGGKLLWKDQMGTDMDDRSADIRIGDNNDVYICGNTSGNLARENNVFRDFVVARYECTGKRLWLHQYGTNAMESIMCMEIGELGHVYLGCRSNGSFGYRRTQRRDLDSCLACITATGKMLWKRQFGTGGWDGTWDMARFMDGSGDILISGCQIPLNSKCQAYCRRYTPEGKLVWTKEFRKRSLRGGTCGRVVAIDSSNNCYHAGVTNADQFGTNNGTGNIYIVRFDSK